jgi:hypothetical protein
MTVSVAIGAKIAVNASVLVMAVIPFVENSVAAYLACSHKKSSLEIMVYYFQGGVFYSPFRFFIYDALIVM